MTNLGDTQCLRATTWKRDGTPVMTVVWPVPWTDGRIAFVTGKGTGKHKRLRHTSRVKLQASDWDGIPLEGSAPVEGEAVLVEDGGYQAVLDEVCAKYGRRAWDASQELAFGYFASIGREHPGYVAIVVTPTA